VSQAAISDKFSDLIAANPPSDPGAGMKNSLGRAVIVITAGLISLLMVIYLRRHSMQFSDKVVVQLAAFPFVLLGLYYGIFRWVRLPLWIGAVSIIGIVLSFVYHFSLSWHGADVVIPPLTNGIGTGEARILRETIESEIKKYSLNSTLRIRPYPYSVVTPDDAEKVLAGNAAPKIVIWGSSDRRLTLSMKNEPLTVKLPGSLTLASNVNEIGVAADQDGAAYLFIARMILALNQAHKSPEYSEFLLEASRVQGLWKTNVQAEIKKMRACKRQKSSLQSERACFGRMRIPIFILHF
jgi:hypothetical protein